MATEKDYYKNCYQSNVESIKNYTKVKRKVIIERIDIEIYRILGLFNLPLSLKNLIVNTCMKYWNALYPGCRYRNLDKLLIISIYIGLKSLNLPSKEDGLRKMSEISTREFNTLIQILKRKII
ncbi:MAG: hypothetical protein EU532_08050 [Promethearchaeota archaeon]|nr:MAG: hypothetical protein EU532_08050 [Candidatus Lokiarchaeota archaeon]